MFKGKHTMALRYNSPGTLIGQVRGYELEVHHDGRATVNGQHLEPLPQTFVEKILKIPVNLKKTGSQVGYPSEPVPRAPFRHLVDQYNLGDSNILYIPESL